MKISLILIICFLGISNTYTQYSSTIRVMTYNINAEKHSDGSYQDIADVITEINPEICGLQKLDSCNSRNPVDVGQWLGTQTDRHATFAPAIKNYNGSTGSYGIGFLSKESPEMVRRLWLEHTSTETDRGVLEISTTLGNETIRVIVTHLAHEGSSYRTSQITKIIPWIDSVGTTDPVIIMADFNAAPTENCMKLLEDAGFSFVKGKNGKILDTSASQGINHILYRPASRWQVIDAGNPAYPASNRNPVWADMELTGTSGITVRRSDDRLRNIFIHLDSDQTLHYEIPLKSTVSLTLFNASGGRVISLFTQKIHNKGIHTVSLKKYSLPKGLYYCHISGDACDSTRPIVLIQ